MLGIEVIVVGKGGVGGRRPVIKDDQKEASTEMGLRDEITWPRVHGGFKTLGWVLVSYSLQGSFEEECIGVSSGCSLWGCDREASVRDVVTRTGPKDDRIL